MPDNLYHMYVRLSNSMALHFLPCQEKRQNAVNTLAISPFPVAYQELLKDHEAFLY